MFNWFKRIFGFGKTTIEDFPEPPVILRNLPEKKAPRNSKPIRKNNYVYRNNQYYDLDGNLIEDLAMIAILQELFYADPETHVDENDNVESKNISQDIADIDAAVDAVRTAANYNPPESYTDFTPEPVKSTPSYSDGYSSDSSSSYSSDDGGSSYSSDD